MGPKLSYSTFPQTHKSGNIGFTANFVFSSICGVQSFLFAHDDISNHEFRL